MGVLSVVLHHPQVQVLDSLTSRALKLLLEMLQDQAAVDLALLNHCVPDLLKPEEPSCQHQSPAALQRCSGCFGRWQDHISF